MIDALFYEDSSIPPEWKALFPDWLIAIGFKVQNDLFEELKEAKTEELAVRRIRDYTDNRGLRLLEPIQITMLRNGSCVYHDWMFPPPKSLNAPQAYANVGKLFAVSPTPYNFMSKLTTNQAQIVVWEDNTANRIEAIEPMHRLNIGLVSRIPRQELLLIVELHWGRSFAPFESQVHHLKPLIRPVEIEIVDITADLVDKLLRNPDELYRIGAECFEDLVQNRIEAMGFKAQRITKTFSKDGGIDLLFWREDAPFPFLGAVQAKYHSSSNKKTGARDVRDFAGTLAALPIAVGVMVTNTAFTFDAQWVASKLHSHIRLRNQSDLRRWISGHFVDALEWREIPAEIELCPGVRVRIPTKVAGQE